MRQYVIIALYFFLICVNFTMKIVRDRMLGMVVASSFEEAVSLIKDRLDIVDTVSQYVVLKKSGANYWGICPFHDDKHPSMSVSPSKGIYKCFSCGAGGDALNFLVKIQNREYKEVILELAEKFGIELPKKFAPSDKTKSQKEQMLKACQKAAEYYNMQLKTAPDSNKAMTYLKSREITDEIISKYTLGWAPNKYDALYNELKKDFKDDILEKAGLILKSNKGGWIDRFRNRIIIPIQSENGDYIAFGARAVDEGQNPKYLNSADSFVYNKSKTLFGLYTAKDAIKECDSVVIMEGYFDVITAQVNGVKNAVASCGTALTADHVKILSRYTKSRKIYLSFDTDSAGVNATKRGSEVIKETLSTLGAVKQFDESHISTSSDNKYACEIRVVSPPQGKDPDEYIRSMGGKAFNEYIKSAPLLIDFLLNNVLAERNNAKTPQEKSELVLKVIDILSDVNNKIIQTEYVKMVSSILDVNENAILKELKTRENIHQLGNSPKVQKKSVTNSSQFEIKAQKNLLSVFLVPDSPLTFTQINEMMAGVTFDDEILINVKSTIDKLTQTVNNVKELIEHLYTEFVDNPDAQAILPELIALSEVYKDLEETDFKNVIKETIAKINRCKHEKEAKQIKSLYEGVNDDDPKALEIQMQLRDKLKKLRQSEKI